MYLIIRAHPVWTHSFTCGKNWFGGCSSPSEYGIRLCSKTKDFQETKKIE